MAGDDRDVAPAPGGGLTRLRAALAAPRGYRKVDALLSAEDPKAAVQALGISELYGLLKEVGLADTVEIVGLASPQQLRGCIDIEIWDKDGVQLSALYPWLVALVDCGFEKLGEVWRTLDQELTALILARSTFVYDLSLGEEPNDDDGRPVMLTPDTFFALKLLDDSDEVTQLIQRVVEDLYRYDLLMVRHTIMAARSEPVPELEEMSYRWRTGRMSDLGYVDFFEALEIFRPLDLETIRIGEGTQDRFDGPEGAEQQMPVVVAERVVGRSFLARALERIDDAATVTRLQTAVMVLVNKVLAAARVKPGDAEAMGRGAEHATATVALGLETLSRGDLGRAEEALRTVSLTRLHRLGYSVPLRLARLAHVLAPRAVTAGEPDSDLIAALCGRRAWFPRALDLPPGVGVRPFESTEDVRRAAEVLARLALRIAVAGSLGVDLVAAGHTPEAVPALDDHVRTALVRLLGGGELSPAPLSADELERFRRGALRDGVLPAEARLAAATAILGLLERGQVKAGREHLAGVVQQWLRDLETSLGGLTDARPDLRFVSGIVVDADRD